MYLAVALLLMFTVYSCEKDNGGSVLDESSKNSVNVHNAQTSGVEDRGGYDCKDICTCDAEAGVSTYSTNVSGWQVDILDECVREIPESLLGVLTNYCQPVNPGFRPFRAPKGHCLTFFVNRIYVIDPITGCESIVNTNQSGSINITIKNRCGNNLVYTNLTVGQSVTVCWSDSCCPATGQPGG